MDTETEVSLDYVRPCSNKKTDVNQQKTEKKIEIN